MPYQFTITELQRMQKPTSAMAADRYDYIGDYINLALAERLEALAAQMGLLNTNMQALLAKMDALVTATKSRTV